MIDEAFQRITAAAAAARSSLSTALSRRREGEQAAEHKQEEPQVSALWRFFEEQATGDTTRRNPSADAMLEVRSYLEGSPLSKEVQTHGAGGSQVFRLTTSYTCDGT